MIHVQYCLPETPTLNNPTPYQNETKILNILFTDNSNQLIKQSVSIEQLKRSERATHILA